MSEEMKDNQPNTEAKTEEATWYLDENTPGQGERPEWMPKNFKYISHLAKSYNELQKKYSARDNISKAPEEYDISDLNGVIEADTEELKGFLQFAKEKNLPQEIVSETLKTTAGIANKLRVDEQKEIEKLGVQGKEKLETVERWVRNYFNDGLKELYLKLPKTAETIELLDGVRTTLSKERQGSNTPSRYVVPETKEAVLSDMNKNYEQYKNDQNYRQTIRDRLSKAMGHNDERQFFKYI